VINKIYDVCVFFFTHKVLYRFRFWKRWWSQTFRDDAASTGK